MNTTGETAVEFWIKPALHPEAFAADLTPETTALMAATQRAGADIVEVEGSHVIMISQPQAVTDHIGKPLRRPWVQAGRRR